MDRISACIAGNANAAATVAWAGWAAGQLGAGLDLLHALEPLPGSAIPAATGGLLPESDATQLREQLGALDARRQALLAEAGDKLLAAARRLALDAGVAEVDTRLSHASLLDSALALEEERRAAGAGGLFVLGEQGPAEATAGGSAPAERHAERLIRALREPVLLVSGTEFRPPERAVIAFDASAGARRLVQMVARSPLLKALPLELAMAGTPAADAQAQLAAARLALLSAGRQVSCVLLEGDAQVALPAHAAAQGQVLLVMAAQGHARGPERPIGSTTIALLRHCPASLLILR